MNVCCSSRASLCYWLFASLAAWAVLAIMGRLWHSLHEPPAVTCLLAMAVGCLANAFKNRTYHCVLTGPLFLIAAILLLSQVKPSLVWALVLVGTSTAFILEWRYSRNLKEAASS